MRFFSWSLVGLTFLLILWGGVVHNTESSLACPDWPLCFGQLMPEMKGNVAVEHGHRLLASAVGLLTLIQAFLLRKGPLSRLGILSVGLVIFQGLLGGLTVLYQLPPLVSTLHLAISLLFFTTLILIANRNPPIPPFAKGGKEGFIIHLTLFLLFSQMVLGAYVRHSGAGLLCPDIPFCYGDPWPDSLYRQIHMVHRFGAVVVVGLLAILAFKSARDPGTLKWLAILLGLSLLQIFLGIYSILSWLGLPAVTAHLGLATLIWGLLIWVRERAGVP